MEMLESGNLLSDETQELSRALEQEIRLSTIINTLPEAIFTTTLEGMITSWNPAAERLFGYSAPEIQGLHVSMIGPAGSGAEFRNLLAKAAAREHPDPYHAIRIDCNGCILETIEAVAPLRDAAGTVVSVAWSSRDAREIKRLESIIWDEKERSETAFGLVSDALIMTDLDGAVIYLNPAAEQLTGWSFTTARGLPAEQIAPLVHEESREPVESPVVTCLRDKRRVEAGFHNVLLRRDGLAIPVEDAAMPVAQRDGGLAGAVLALRPVGRTQPSGPANSYVAGTDEPTGMLNRREFEHRLELALVTAARDNASHTLLTVKLRGFDDFVQSRGPVAKLELLKQVAVMLRTQIRDTDTAARTQDGEFTVLLDHCPLDRGRKIAEQARRVLGEFPFYWEHQPHRVGVQIGVVPVTPDSGNVARTMQIAHVVCHLAETDGVDLVHVLDAGDINRVLSSRRWDHTRQVASAFDEGRFRLYGQRIQPVSVENGYDDQIEMLVHMLSTGGEVIGPATIVPAADRLGLLAKLDRWVISSVFRMVAGNLRQDIASWSINLSEESLTDPTFPGFVREQFQSSRVPPQRICFEVDEAVAMSNMGATQHAIDSLRSLGYAFCLSNFGGNPHSFAYLRNLRADFLKLDANLTRGLMSDPVNRAVVDGIVNVARVLGIRTIAGMVEDEELIDVLELLGVDYVQGYAIAEPIPLPLAPGG